MPTHPLPDTLTPAALGGYLGRPEPDRLLFEHGCLELRHLVALEHADGDLPVRMADTPLGWMESQAETRWVVTEAGFFRVVAELAAGAAGAAAQDGARPVVGTAAAAEILGVSRATLDRLIRGLDPEDRPARVGSRSWWPNHEEVVVWFERVAEGDAAAGRVAGAARAAGDNGGGKRPRRTGRGRRPAGAVDFHAERDKLLGR